MKNHQWKCCAVRAALVIAWAVKPSPGNASELKEDIAKFPRDAAYVAMSPLRLGSYSWAVPVAAGAVAVTMAYDGPLRDRLIRLRMWDGQKKLRKAGDALQFSGVALGVALVAAGELKDDETLTDKGWLQWEGAATAATAGQLIKWVAGRKRPGGNDPDYFKPFSSNSSFPSGHTLMAFTAAEITVQEFPSWWVRVPAYLVAASVGVSRIASDRHWTGDVLASALLGTGIGHALVSVHQRPSGDWRILATEDGLKLAYSF